MIRPSDFIEIAKKNDKIMQWTKNVMLQLEIDNNKVNIILGHNSDEKKFVDTIKEVAYVKCPFPPEFINGSIREFCAEDILIIVFKNNKIEKIKIKFICKIYDSTKYLYKMDYYITHKFYNYIVSYMESHSDIFQDSYYNASILI